MRPTFPILAALLSLPAAAFAESPPPGPSFDCARASQPVEKAICADEGLSAMDRLLDRVFRLARDGMPVDQASALKGEQVRWMVERARAFKAAGEERTALVGLYDGRLRAVIAKGGPQVLPAALAEARPIDPLAEAGREAEDSAAFLAYTLTALYPDPPAPDAGGEAEVMSPYERYAGFTYAAALPGGGLFVAVPVDCGAYQCSYSPYWIDRGKGTAARLAVEGIGDDGKRRSDPAGIPVGIPSVLPDGRVEVFEQARGAGDCGTKWRWTVTGAALALAETVEKPDCDGNADWSRATVRRYP